jgi:hypothetical protein
MLSDFADMNMAVIIAGSSTFYSQQITEDVSMRLGFYLFEARASFCFINQSGVPEPR